MRLYPNLVKAVVDALEKIFVEGAQADIVVEHTLKQDAKWGARDRRFIAGYIYDIVRWYRLYLSCLNEQQQTNNLHYSIFAASHILKGFELPPWKEFEAINVEEIKEAFQKSIKVRKLKTSIPDWLDDIGALQLGESTWEKEMEHLNNEAGVYLRVNTLKTSAAALLNVLKSENIEVEIIEDELFDAEQKPIKVLKRQRLQQLASYNKGFFEIQDATSQLIAPFLRLAPGMFVIDACAGAGGKTLHIASIMKNSGNILAMDVEEIKLKELKKRANRAGVSIVSTIKATEEAILKNKEKADRLLLDVPCSGLGVLKRNPDSKWKLTPAFMSEIKLTQATILSSYSSMLKPEGIMVYATCSILPSENQNQVSRFLEESLGSFTLLEEKTVLPSQGYDGFYMACIKKLR